jgi:hypothetical protein
MKHFAPLLAVALSLAPAAAQAFPMAAQVSVAPLAVTAAVFNPFAISLMCTVSVTGIRADGIYQSGTFTLPVLAPGLVEYAYSVAPYPIPFVNGFAVAECAAY